MPFSITAILQTPNSSPPLTCAAGSTFFPMAISLQFCRISTRPELSVPETRIFRQRKPSSLRCSAAGEAAAASSSSSATADSSDFDAKVFRHNLTRSDNYNRRGFGHKKETLERMSKEYTSMILCEFLAILIVLMFWFQKVESLEFDCGIQIALL